MAIYTLHARVQGIDFRVCIFQLEVKFQPSVQAKKRVEVLQPVHLVVVKETEQPLRETLSYSQVVYFASFQNNESQTNRGVNFALINIFK